MLRTPKCPVCGKKLVFEKKPGEADARRPSFYPFCSERCKLIDLGHWLGEQYTISETLRQDDEEYSDSLPDS